MIYGEGPIIKNIAGDLNKLFLQGTRAGQPINNVEGDAAADQATVQLMADRDPVIRDISTGLGYAGREVTVSGTGALQLVNSLGRPLKSWSVELDPYQEGSGDPSPENVRPIRGTNKLILTTAGKNLFNPNYDDYIVSSGAYLYISDCYPSTALRMTLIDKDPSVDISGCYIGFQNGITASNTSPTAFRWVIQDGLITSNVTNRVASGLLTGVFVYPKTAETFDKLLRRYNIMVEIGTAASNFAPYTVPSQTVVDVPTLGKNILNIEAGSHNAWSFVKIPNNLKPNTQYTLSLNGGTTYYYRLYLGNSQQSTRALTQAITGGQSATFTTPSDMSTEPLLALAGSVSGAGNELLSNILPQVELGPTKTSYEPYTNTIYIGKLIVDDFGSGTIVLSHAVKRATSFNGGFGSTGNGYAAWITVENGSRGATLIRMCNLFKYNANEYTSMPLYSYTGGSGADTTWTFILPSTVTNHAQANQWLIDNGGYIEFTYGLTTPIIVPITTPDIPTPEGDGSVWIIAEDGIITNFSATYLQSE